MAHARRKLVVLADSGKFNASKIGLQIGFKKRKKHEFSHDKRRNFSRVRLHHFYLKVQYFWSKRFLWGVFKNLCY